MEGKDCKEHEGGAPYRDGLMETLPRNQGGPGRHRCPYCAYDRGHEDGRCRAKVERDKNWYCEQHNGGDPVLEQVVGELPENQGGTGRHRCPYCAYERGHRAGYEQEKGAIRASGQPGGEDPGTPASPATAEGKDCKAHRGGARHREGLMETLPRNQGGEGRHKCPYCAYDRGYEAGRRRAKAERDRNWYCERHRRGDPALDEVIGVLPENQGGVGRHRCPYCAYERGLRAGYEQEKGAIRAPESPDGEDPWASGPRVAEASG